MEMVLKNADQVLPASHDNPRDAAGYIVAVVRVLLLLHHDFQDFLIENHARLSAATPAKCSQIRNLINSAYPSSGMELPDPFSTGLKLERMDDMRRNPVIRMNLGAILENAGLKDTLDGSLSSKRASVSELAVQLSQYGDDGALVQVVALYICTEAISAAGSKSQPFNKASPHFAVLQGLANSPSAQLTNLLIDAMVNQLRYPNTHTYWFSQALLELFISSAESAMNHTQLQETIATVLLSRLMPMRPHPWGLLVTFLELAKNKEYDFEALPFVRENEEIWSRPRGLERLSAPGMPPPGMGSF
jgi:CCR4-NOT transcription complex subunit 1